MTRRVLHFITSHDQFTHMSRNKEPTFPTTRKAVYMYQDSNCIFCSGYASRGPCWRRRLSLPPNPLDLLFQREIVLLERFLERFGVRHLFSLTLTAVLPM